MPFDKLYIKIKCTICKGTRIFNSGHHDSMNPMKWKTCPYCDHNGHMMIEASVSAVACVLKPFSKKAIREIAQELELDIGHPEEE